MARRRGRTGRGCGCCCSSWPEPRSSDRNRSTFRVEEVVPIGTRTPTGVGSTVTVTGPARPGLPGGADSEVERWFPTVHVPVRVEPDPGARRTTGVLPTNTLLVGEGRGRAVRLEQDPGCAGALAAPFEGCACHAVPDGFEPRYLVLRNDDVAVDLRPDQRTSGTR